MTDFLYWTSSTLNLELSTVSIREIKLTVQRLAANNTEVGQTVARIPLAFKSQFYENFILQLKS